MLSLQNGTGRVWAGSSWRTSGVSAIVVPPSTWKTRAQCCAALGHGVGAALGTFILLMPLPGGGPVPGCHSPSALCHLQWVLTFEIFIPLVLFFILLGLRQKKPTIPVKEGECDLVVPGTRIPGGSLGPPLPPQGTGELFQQLSSGTA